VELAVRSQTQVLQFAILSFRMEPLGRCPTFSALVATTDERCISRSPSGPKAQGRSGARPRWLGKGWRRQPLPGTEAAVFEGGETPRHGRAEVTEPLEVGGISVGNPGGVGAGRYPADWGHGGKEQGPPDGDPFSLLSKTQGSLTGFGTPGGGENGRVQALVAQRI